MLEINEHDEADQAERSSCHMVTRDISQTLRERRALRGISLGHSTPRANTNAVSEVMDTVYRRVNDDEGAEPQASSVDLLNSAKTSQEKKKLILIMVGLPGRGKTYLCNKLMCYLNWCARASLEACCRAMSHWRASRTALQPTTNHPFCRAGSAI
jgi:6-phosphofructo-2-kinase